jgi:hypothetical protein
MIDFTGYLKVAGYHRRAMWSDEPVVYVGASVAPAGRRRWGGEPVQNWYYQEGQNVQATAYFNTPYVRLKLNGKQIGDVKEYNGDTYSASWTLPYEAGTLVAEGLDKDKNVVATWELKTAGRPSAISAKADKTIISADRGVSQIEIQIVDENGNPVYMADNEITCMSRGPVRILGIESGSNTDMTDNTARRKRVNNGRLIAYVQATGESGEATINFSSMWLDSAQVKIEVE